MGVVINIKKQAFKTILYNNDYCVRDHRVHGVRILPGVFILDLIYRTASLQGISPRAIELRNVVFLEPIATSELHDREIRLDLVEEDGHWAVSVRSRKIAGGVALGEDWARNCTAELHASESEPEAILLGEWQNEAVSEEDADELYAFARSLHIDHQDFMKARGTLRRGANWLMAEAHLGELAQAHLPDFCAHPAYLDFATLLPLSVLRRLGRFTGSQPFIPIHIERFRILEPLGKSCIVVLRDAEVSHPSEEIVRANFALCSPDGAPRVVFGGFAAKRIRENHMMRQLVSPPAAGAPINDRPKELAAAIAITPDETRHAAHQGGAQGGVCKLIADRLGTDAAPLDLHKPFYELGLESIHLLALVSDIEEQAGVELYPTLLFEQTTIAELSAYLNQRFPEQFTALTAAPPTPAVIPDTIPSSPALSSAAADDDIAIIGLAGRYPMARNPEEFWANLRAGKDCISEIPPDRWDVNRYFSKERGRPGRTHSRWGGCLDGYDEFDSLFFNISPQEAETMDPHERLFLEAVWSSIEDAGYTRERLERAAHRAERGRGLVCSSV